MSKEIESTIKSNPNSKDYYYGHPFNYYPSGFDLGILERIVYIQILEVIDTGFRSVQYKAIANGFYTIPKDDSNMILINTIHVADEARYRNNHFSF